MVERKVHGPIVNRLRVSGSKGTVIEYPVIAVGGKEIVCEPAKDTAESFAPLPKEQAFKLLAEAGAKRRRLPGVPGARRQYPISKHRQASETSVWKRARKGGGRFP